MVKMIKIHPPKVWFKRNIWRLQTSDYPFPESDLADPISKSAFSWQNSKSKNISISPELASCKRPLQSLIPPLPGWKKSFNRSKLDPKSLHVSTFTQLGEINIQLLVTLRPNQKKTHTPILYLENAVQQFNVDVACSIFIRQLWLVLLFIIHGKWANKMPVFKMFFGSYHFFKEFYSISPSFCPAFGTPLTKDL